MSENSHSLSEDMQDDDPSFEQVGGLDGVSTFYESPDGYTVCCIHFEERTRAKLYAPDDGAMKEPLAVTGDEYGRLEQNIEELFRMRKVLNVVGKPGKNRSEPKVTNGE